jgi:hypothetical protein
MARGRHRGKLSAAAARRPVRSRGLAVDFARGFLIAISFPPYGLRTEKCEHGTRKPNSEDGRVAEQSTMILVFSGSPLPCVPCLPWLPVFLDPLNQ